MDNIKKISHRKWNKLIEIINGNREYKKPVKRKRYFKVVTWNKGNSNLNFDSDKFLAIKTEILNQMETWSSYQKRNLIPSMKIISGANFPIMNLTSS